MIKLSFFGTPIEIHFSFFLLLAILVAAGNGIFAASTIFFSFLHELAHGKMAQGLGYVPEKITAGFFGGVLHLQAYYVKPFHEIVIHLSGPALNLFIAAILYVLSFFWAPPFIYQLILSNLILGAFNLMPFYPLDGGKIIAVYLSFFFGYGGAYWLSKNFSLLFSVFLFLLGIYLVQYNVANLLISVLAINLVATARADYEFMLYKLSLKELRRINGR